MKPTHTHFGNIVTQAVPRPRSLKKNLRSCSALLTFACLLAICLGAPKLAAGQAARNPADDIGISVKPALFEFKAGKGEKIVRNVTVMNNQNTPLQIKMYVGDWMRDTVGEHSYYPAGTLPNSCANWVKLSQNFLEVPARGNASFELTFTTPDSQAAMQSMKWAMLFIEYAEERTMPKTNKKDVVAMLVKKQRIGMHIYQTPPNVNHKEIKMVDFKPVPGQKNTFRIAYENTGNVQVACKSYLELTSLDESGTPNKIETMPYPSFPGQRRIVDITIPEKIAKGKYNVIAAVDAGEDVPLEAAQREIEVK